MALLDGALAHLSHTAQEGLQLRRDALQGTLTSTPLYYPPSVVYHRVPPEILMEILLNFLPNGFYKDTSDAKREDHILPSHICTG